MSEELLDSRGSFGVVLLAAGASRRMGRPKLLLPWGDGTVLSHLVRSWQELGAARIVAVIPPGLPPLRDAMAGLSGEGIHSLVNPDPDRGMISSIQCAAAWAEGMADLTHWAISLGDQPQVRWETLRRLVEAGRRQPDRVVQPARHGRGRHPVWMPSGLFRVLAGSQVPHLKAFLEAHAADRELIEMEDAGLDLDMDHPADYEAALRLGRAS